MMVLALRKLGNICCGHKMFLNKIRNIFCVPDTKFVSATNVARAGKRGNISVGNNVSSFARAFRSNYVTSILITKLTFAMFFAQTEYIIRCYVFLYSIRFVAFMRMNTSKEVNRSFSLLVFCQYSLSAVDIRH